MAANIEEIFRSFVVKKIKEIEDEKQQSGKVINEANGEIKPVLEPKVSEEVADTTVDVQEELIVNSNDHVLPGILEEQQNDNPDNKENLTADSVTTEQIKSTASDNKDSATPPRKNKKHKHKHHHKHKSKKKKKKKRRKKDAKKRDHSRSRSGSRLSLKSQSGLQLQSQSQSMSPSNNECSSRKSKNLSVLTKSGSTGSSKNMFDEAPDTNTVLMVGVGKECSVVGKKPLLQDNCNKSLHVKENSAADIDVATECTAVGNVVGLLATASVGEQNQESRLVHNRGSNNVQSKSTQTVEEKGKNDITEARRTKRSRSRSHSKSTKHRKSELHSHAQHSPVKSCASSSSRHHTSQSSCSRKRPSPVRLRSKSTSREEKKHTESSPKSKRKQSRSCSKAKNEQKSKSRSPSRLHHRSRSHSIARTKRQSKSRHCSRSCSRSKHRSRTRSGSPVRSKSRVKRSQSPRPRSKSDDRGRHRSSSRAYLSRLVRTRRSPDWRRRSRSPLRRKSTSRTPERLTDLDKAQLLEIAKANAAAMCAKAGMPFPANLKPVVPLVKNVITKKIGCSSIQELTEKCKKIVESNDDHELGNEPSVSEEDESFNNQPIKVNELKPISFSFNNATVKPAAKTQVALTKEFPVSSGTQHRKKEVLNVYGEWVPVEKDSEETTDDVFTDVCTQAVDISTTMSERATAQKRLVENPHDVEAISMILRAQEQIDVWAQSNSLPGQFTGSTGAQVLTYEELTNSGPQAWIRKVMNTLCSVVYPVHKQEMQLYKENLTGARNKLGTKAGRNPGRLWLGFVSFSAWLPLSFVRFLEKQGKKEMEDQFLKAAPLTGGMGAQLMQKMGWREGEGLGKNKNGPVEPIVVDFKTDRKGLVAEGEKTQKKSGNLPIMKDLSGKHPVSALMEICNKKKWPPPDFLMVHDSGPDHCKHFLFKVMINGTEYKPSLASPNKKHAKASAATVALQAMGLVPKDGGASATSFKSVSDDAM